MNKKNKHKHLWTSDGIKYYHLGGTRLWLFRRCINCKKIQDSIVDTDSLIRWRDYIIKPKKP